jgi:transmembrane sensor
MDLKKKIDNGLIIRYLQRETNEEDNKSLLDWVNKSEENKKEFLELKNCWISASVSNPEIDTILASGWKKIENKLEKSVVKNSVIPGANLTKVRTIWARVAQIAAIFLISSILTWIFIAQPFEKESAEAYFEFSTPKGARSVVNLPDGSKVWLNAESVIRFPQKFSNKYRKLYLEGEAFFDIKSDKSHPFLVKTSDINVRVTGTAFNIKSYPGEGTIETTLVRGQIIIEKEGNKSNKQELVLKPNQRVTFIKKEGEIYLDNVSFGSTMSREKLILDENADIEKYIAWKDGKLLFDNEKFESLAIKLERWYNITIHIDDEKLKNIRFTGTFEDETIEQGLNVMKLTTPIIYRFEKNELYISLSK